jgi:hypothetical protein
MNDVGAQSNFFAADAATVSCDTETPRSLCFSPSSRAEGSTPMHLEPVPDLNWPRDLFGGDAAEQQDVARFLPRRTDRMSTYWRADIARISKPSAEIHVLFSRNAQRCEVARPDR